MGIWHLVCRLFFVLLIIGLAITSLPHVAVAQEETIELAATYPRVESDAPEAVFKFTVDLIYQGNQTREFDLRTSGPSGWNTYVTSRDESARISVIKLEPNKPDLYQVKVITSPLPTTILKSQDYTITLEASSGTIRDSIGLTAVVMPIYSLDLLPESWYHREAIAGEDNFFTITVRNTGSGELTDIEFSAHKPRDWIVEFQPDEIDRLAPGSSQEVEVNIKPATKTADRYYDVTLIVEANQVRQTTTVGVRVEESKWLWGWIGGGIALLVVVAFAVIFLRLNRGK